MSRMVVVEHLARVEGHGGIEVELLDDAVGRVEFRIFEGARLVEGLVRGRSYEDVAQIVSRICAICSVAHTLTSIKATEDAFGIEASAQTALLRDLMYRGENIESHALHIFLLALPDYLGYSGAIAMAAEHREAVALGLRLKKLGNSIQEIIGGRAIHPVNAVLGGFGKLPSADDLVSLRQELRNGRGESEAVVDLLCSLPPADYCRDDIVFAALEPPSSYGYYEGNEIVVLADGAQHKIPAVEYGTLATESTVPHSSAKHSRYNGRPFMVGALARLATRGDLMKGHGRTALKRLGLELPFRNPLDNNKAQAAELIFDIEQALETVERLLGSALVRESPPYIRPRAGTGTGVTEAPRGILIHKYNYDDAGRVTSADIITPTALNAASIERHFRLAVDQSTDKDITSLKRKLEMIARAYDPCISCSVHVLRKAGTG